METIKDFLVSIGWDYSEAKQKRFVDAMRGAEFQAKLLADALEALARKAWQTVSDVAEAFDRLYFSSQRTGATVSTIRDFGYAVRQLGGSAEAAQASLEAMGQKLRENPANIAYLNALGFGINKITGHLEVQRDLLAKFQQMPMAVAEQYRGLAGEDERTFLAMRDPQMLRLMDEAAAFRKRIGFDPDQAAKDANAFMTTWRRVSNELGVIADDLLTKLMKAFDGPLQEFKKFLDANGPEISKSIDKITDAIGAMTKAWVDDFEKFLKDPESLKSFQNTMHNLATDVKWIAESFHGFIIDLQRLSTFNQYLSYLFPQARLFSGGLGGSPIGGSLNVPGLGATTQATPPVPDNAPASGGGLTGWWKRTMPTWLGGSGDKTSGATPPASGGGAPAGGVGGAVGSWWTPDRMQHAVARLQKEAGLSEAGAVGLVARWAGVEAKAGPSAVNPYSGAFGIGQWLGSRKTAIAGNVDFDAQLSHAIGELNGSESGAAQKLRSAKTLAEGATGASAFERAEGYDARTGRDNWTGVTPTQSVYNALHPAAASDADQSAKIGRFVTDPDGSKRWVRWGVDSSSVPDNGASSPSAASPAKTPSWADVQRDAAEGAAQIKKWEAQKNPWGSLQNYWSTPPALGADGGGGSDNHVTVTQHNTFNVDGANDPSIVAHMVASNQKRTVQDITSTMIGAHN